MKKLMNTKEAGLLLGVSANAMAIWRHRGVGPDYIRLSERNIRYEKKVLKKFMKERSVESAVGLVTRLYINNKHRRTVI